MTYEVQVVETMTQTRIFKVDALDHKDAIELVAARIKAKTDDTLDEVMREPYRLTSTKLTATDHNHEESRISKSLGLKEVRG